MLSALYAAIARRRRERFARRPDLRRRLRRPVISVGNIAVGGRGKTPTVACLARLLREMGERPSILSRGYARRTPVDGVVIVRDPGGMRADLDRSGDEPLMLARRLPGVSILASSDRYIAGRLAERHLDATVHLLDDGFQHLQLDRDIDLVIVAAEDLDERATTLPSGRLREPVDTLLAADAVLTTDEDLFARRAMTRYAPLDVFKLRKALGAPTGDGGSTSTSAVDADSPPASFAVAGIARPEPFFEDLRAAGHVLAGAMTFRDHHRFSRRDLERVVQSARAAGAVRLLTTEKDYVRLLPFRPFPMPVAWVPLTLEPDPMPAFRDWLADALRTARDGQPAPAVGQAW